MRFISIPFRQATTFALFLPLVVSNLTTSLAQNQIVRETATTAEQVPDSHDNVRGDSVLPDVIPDSIRAIDPKDKTLLDDDPMWNEPGPSPDSQAVAAQLRRDLEDARTDLAKTKELIGEIIKQNKQLAESRELPPLKDAEVRVFQLKNTKADSAAKKVELLFGSQPLRIAVDEASNGLIIFGKAEAIPQVEQLIIKLDELAVAGASGFSPNLVDRDVVAAPPAAPQRSLMLRVFWLADGVQDLPSADEYLPAGVINSLAKLGMSDARLVTQTVNSLSVEEGEQFVQFATNVPAMLFQQPMTLTSSGTLSATTDGRAEVEMQLSVGGEGVNCELKGSLTTLLGHYMVLGTANSLIPEYASQDEIRIKIQEAAQRLAEEEGGMGRGGGYGGRGGGGRGMAMGELPSAKYNSSRFAFVVQVIEAESFEPEGNGQ